jgi:hypothetical protein
MSSRRRSAHSTPPATPLRTPLPVAAAANCKCLAPSLQTTALVHLHAHNQKTCVSEFNNDNSDLFVVCLQIPVGGATSLRASDVSTAVNISGSLRC